MKCNCRLAGLALALVFCLCLVLPCYAWEDGEEVGQLLLTGARLDVRDRMRAEVPLGDLCADAVREATGADFAIVNAGDMARTHLHYGPITVEAIRNSFTEDRELAVVTVTAEQLKEVLEAAVASMTADPETQLLDREASESEAFPQVSGLYFTCDVPNLVGHKVIYLRDEAGNFLDDAEPGTTYRLAATSYMLSGGYGLPAFEEYEPLDLTLSDALCEYFTAHGTIESVQTKRIDLAGIADEKLISHIPIWAVVVALLFFTYAGLLWKRKKDYEE